MVQVKSLPQQSGPESPDLVTKYAGWKVKDLRERCTFLGLDLTRAQIHLKRDLVNCLAAAEGSGYNPAPPPPSETFFYDYGALTQRDLEAMIADRQVPNGMGGKTKEDLIQVLRAHDAIRNPTSLAVELEARPLASSSEDVEGQQENPYPTQELVRDLLDGTRTVTPYPLCPSESDSTLYWLAPPEIDEPVGTYNVNDSDDSDDSDDTNGTNDSNDSDRISSHSEVTRRLSSTSLSTFSDPKSDPTSGTGLTSDFGFAITRSGFKMKMPESGKTKLGSDLPGPKYTVRSTPRSNTIPVEDQGQYEEITSSTESDGHDSSPESASGYFSSLRLASTSQLDRPVYFVQSWAHDMYGRTQSAPNGTPQRDSQSKSRRRSRSSSVVSHNIPSPPKAFLSSCLPETPNLSPRRVPCPPGQFPSLGFPRVPFTSPCYPKSSDRSSPLPGSPFSSLKFSGRRSIMDPPLNPDEPFPSVEHGTAFSSSYASTSRKSWSASKSPLRHMSSSKSPPRPRNTSRTPPSTEMLQLLPGLGFDRKFYAPPKTAEEQTIPWDVQLEDELTTAKEEEIATEGDLPRGDPLQPIWSMSRRHPSWGPRSIFQSPVVSPRQSVGAVPFSPLPLRSSQSTRGTISRSPRSSTTAAPKSPAIQSSFRKTTSRSSKKRHVSFVLDKDRDFEVPHPSPKKRSPSPLKVLSEWERKTVELFDDPVATESEIDDLIAPASLETQPGSRDSRPLSRENELATPIERTQGWLGVQNAMVPEDAGEEVLQDQDLNTYADSEDVSDEGSLPLNWGSGNGVIEEVEDGSESSEQTMT